MKHAPFATRGCPLCGSHRSIPEVSSGKRAERLSPGMLRPFWSGLFKEKVFFTYHRCSDCGLLYNPTYFRDAQLGALYAQMAPNMDLVSDDAVAATQRGYLARALQAGPPGGDYLEIGPDVGHIAEMAAQREAFETYWLVEPNIAVHDVLRRVVGTGRVSLLDTMHDLSPVPDNSVGLAVMVHVLDHLTDPLEMLRQIRRTMRPDGVLMIVTHNERSALRRALGRRWPPFCLQHPELYNPDTMRLLLDRAGFAGIEIERSANYFPADFLLRQAAWAAGMKLTRAPLGALSLKLRLGNMLTVARAPVQAACAVAPREPAMA